MSINCNSRQGGEKLRLDKTDIILIVCFLGMILLPLYGLYYLFFVDVPIRDEIRMASCEELKNWKTNSHREIVVSEYFAECEAEK